MSFSQRSESVQTATLVVVLEKLDKAYFANKVRTQKKKLIVGQMCCVICLRETDSIHMEDC